MTDVELRRSVRATDGCSSRYRPYQLSARKHRNDKLAGRSAQAMTGDYNHQELLILSVWMRLLF